MVASVNQKLATLADARAFAFLPPAIPGIGQAGGVDFFIQDRAGKSVEYLWDNVQKFLAAARKRPELARMNLTFSPSVPQIFADVDKDKVFKLGVSIGDVYRALQALLGGYYVNQFNRFGRVWKVFVEAEPAVSDQQERRRPVLRSQQAGPDGPAVDLGHGCAGEFGPEYTTRFNEYRGIEIFALPAPGYSTGDAMNAVAEVAGQVLPRDMGYAWNGISYQQSVAGGGAGGLRAVARAGLPDPRRTLRKLVAALQRPAQRADRGLRRVRRTVVAPLRQRHLRADRANHADRAYRPRTPF